jgi:hypothetical protein
LKTKKDEFMGLSVQNVDVKLCFKRLNGIISSDMSNIVPIKPIMQLPYDEPLGIGGNMENKPSSDQKKFDILDPDSWELASDKPFLWNGTMVYNEEKKPIIEQDMAGLFHSIWRFLERNGEMLSKEDKIKSIKNVLNRMAGNEDAVLEEQPVPSENFSGGKFDPRNHETYKYATNNQLVIDGVKIYDIYYENDKKKRKPESETSFVTIVNMMTTMDKRWKIAKTKAKEEYQLKGVNDPTHQTPGYKARMNKIYNSLKKDDLTLTNEDYRETMDNLIQSRLDECRPRKKYKYGGYAFSEAQMEITDGQTDEQRIKIGEIMVKGLSEKKRSYQLKQDLFSSLGNKSEFFVKLHNNIYSEIEENAMQDYFSCFDQFETEEEVYDFFNKSKYLKKHPQMKEKVIEYALYLHNIGNNEEE